MHDDDATRTQLPADPDLTRTRPARDIDATRSQTDVERTRSIEKTDDAPILAGYQIHEILGEGGMGVVYKATHLKLNRILALKMILGGRAVGSKELSRFVAEAEAVAAIDHPNVVRVFDSGNAEGRPYLSMEFLPGGSLAEKLKANNPASPGRESGGSNSSRSPGLTSGARLEPHTAADLVRKLALAVQAAHDLQIVHRDLKTANVLFDAAGEPRVTDFGLAKKAGGSDLTGTNAIMGTPAYMAPEQAKGESKFVGPQADVWALGVILYECLTGARPFTGSNEIEIIRKVVDAEPASIRSRISTLPLDLELIAQKCLAKDPAHRYPNARMLAEDLRRWLAGEPVSVKAAGPIERSVKWVKRNKIAAGIMAASVIGVAITSTLAAVAYRESQRADSESAASKAAEEQAIAESQRADENSKQAQANAEKADEAAKANARQVVEQRRLLDVMRIKEAGTAFDGNLAHYAREILDEVAPVNRTSAWHLARRYCEGSDFGLYPNGSYAECLAWSPDAYAVACPGMDHIIRIWNTATNQCIGEFKGHTDIIQSISWSPDGLRLASCGNDKTIRVWEVRTASASKNSTIANWQSCACPGVRTVPYWPARVMTAISGCGTGLWGAPSASCGDTPGSYEVWPGTRMAKHSPAEAMTAILGSGMRTAG